MKFNYFFIPLVVAVLALATYGFIKAPSKESTGVPTDLHCPSTVILERNSYCSVSSHNLIVNVKPRIDQVIVELKAVRVDQVKSLCNNQHSKGCSKLTLLKTGDVHCEVIVPDTTELAVLGHELRHCFEGGWHN
jgi:hypothetical protein